MSSHLATISCSMECLLLLQDLVSLRGRAGCGERFKLGARRLASSTVGDCHQGLSGFKFDHPARQPQSLPQLIHILAAILAGLELAASSPDLFGIFPLASRTC